VVGGSVGVVGEDDGGIWGCLWWGGGGFGSAAVVLSAAVGSDLWRARRAVSP
jgi:hypothetical protein